MSGWSGLPVPVEDSIDYMPPPPSSLHFHKAGHWPKQSVWAKESEQARRSAEIDETWAVSRGHGRIGLVYQGTRHEVQLREEGREQQWWLDYGHPHSTNLRCAHLLDQGGSTIILPYMDV